MAFIREKKFKKIASIEASAENPKQLLDLAKSHNIETEPLDVLSLVRAMGLTVRFEPMENQTSGKLVKDKKSGRWIILVNSLHHPHRQRFTIAHELAHYCMHSPRQDTFEDMAFFRKDNFPPYEREANRFAAELLMPEKSFREQVTKSPQVESIAKYFKTSSSAVIYRAEELGYKRTNR